MSAGCEKRLDGLRITVAKRQNAKSVPMQELEMRPARRDLAPETKDAETALSHISIVKEHNGVLRELRPPDVEVMPNSVVGVQTVDVQQIDAVILEMANGLVECRPH
ncbi:hypothetical protein [Mesorhizobium sp. M1406]|uniref:hypothetical protein n=1 Tax=Mesorhizobium sp. M1406 TaxID=2957099 RepID=UPI003339EA8C